MDITRLRGDDSSGMREFWDLIAAVHEHDSPGSPPPQRDSIETDVADQRPGMRQRHHLAYLDGQVVGTLWTLYPLRDSTSVMYLRIDVHPQCRRQGIGSQLYDLAWRHGIAEGRSTVISRAVEPLPNGPYRSSDGAEFLRAKGFKVAHSMCDYQLDLDEVARKIETGLLDDFGPHAWEYELIGFAGPTPEPHLPAVARLADQFSGDLPIGDLAISEKHVDVERLRAAEERDVANKITAVSTYARHQATGELVARNVIKISEATPEHATVESTMVGSEHRGHRLGSLVKLENHQLVRSRFPAVRTLRTSVADSNTHMLAINQRMGFAEVDRQLDFQRTVR